MGAKRWTKDEEAELQQLAGQGVAVEEIAALAGRPADAVEARLKKLQRGKPVSAAAEEVEKAQGILGAPTGDQENLAQLILWRAMQHARLGDIAQRCYAAGVSLPVEVMTFFDLDERDGAEKVFERVLHVGQRVIEGGRLVGWEVELPAGCGLRSVQVRVA